MHAFSTVNFFRKPLRLSVLLILICALFLSGCSRSLKGSSPLEATGFYFDTVISVRIYSHGSEEILSKCMALAEHYENLLSPNVEGSDIWKINHSGGQYVAVSDDTLALLKTALHYAELSDGLVDPTIGSLSQLWNFGSGNQETIPEKSDIRDALTHVGWHLVEIKGNEVRLTDAKTQIDLGFIAKGFIGDKIKQFLRSQNVSSALINLGGNVVALGSRPDGSPFRVGVRDPFHTAGEPLLVLDALDLSVVSSGDYERFFEKDGRRYHHILSTETGYPAKGGLSQVTIISSDAAIADALSTLCFISGYEKAVSLLENHPDIQAVFVTEDGQILYANCASDTVD
ncbi:MAG: FAD:protein FMN transferase [Lachnospiraceae bacterium]|nr:FAD:protein FMN transferase [Lachnospiraceae bacterium]